MDIEHAVESKLAKTINRIVLPALATVAITVITWMVNDLRNDSKTTAQKAIDLENRVLKVDGKVDLLNAKIDQGVLWRVTEIERRLNTVEQAQKTP